MPIQSYINHCHTLKKDDLFRDIDKNIIPLHPLIDFSHNDYLGLSQHPHVIVGAQRYMEQYGVGSGASRVLLQNQQIFRQLEDKIAKSKNAESALLFSSGYQANVTVLSALLDKRILGEEPLVFSDRLNHASLIQGCQLAGVRQHRYHHLDMNHLEFLLKKYAKPAPGCSPKVTPKFILTETVFGMDGDVVDLKALTELSNHYGAFVYVDEAHASGMLGPNGYGLSSNYASQIHLSMGTFSKAIGVSGAYVTCSQDLKNYLQNKCTGFVYSTAPSPALMGAINAAWDLLPSFESARQDIQHKAQLLRDTLRQNGINVGKSSTHIVPVIVGEANRCLKLQQSLWSQGMIAPAIRPPSVPQGTARLRIGINITHTKSQLNQLGEEILKWR